MGAPFECPVPVQTLDEIVLILRVSPGLRFDDNLPHFHLYGTDICLRAQSVGRKNYAISAFCIHNTNQGFALPKEFYECYKHVKRTWKKYLPITASCARITRFNLAMYERRLREIYFSCRRQKPTSEIRTRDVTQLIEDVNEALRRADSDQEVLVSAESV